MAIKKNFMVGTKRGLNVRSAPSMEADVIRVLAYEEKVTVDHDMEVPDGWIALKDKGFVRKEFLK